jgi:hypothetical protein
VADWVTISSLATAGGTLALAGATYASVRSSNRSARVAELALQEQRRPVLMQSNEDDRAQVVSFSDRSPLSVPGGGACVVTYPDAVYLVASVRNVGAGIAVMQGWQSHAIAGEEPDAELRWRRRVTEAGPPEVEDFRPFVRDQYVAAGDIGIWQGAVRDPEDPLLAEIAGAVRARRPFSLDLLYTDQVGGQRTISRFAMRPGDAGWTTTAARHWYLDAPAPR